MRQHTNTAEMPFRRLKKQYDNTSTFVGSTAGATNALGDTNPNTLNNNIPSKSNATGVSGKNGIVSFLHNGTTGQVFTLFFWNKRLNQINNAQGWIKASEDSTGSTKAVDQYSLCTFTAPESVPYFLMATDTTVTECVVTGDADGQNPNTDPALTGGGT